MCTFSVFVQLLKANYHYTESSTMCTSLISVNGIYFISWYETSGVMENGNKTICVVSVVLN